MASLDEPSKGVAFVMMVIAAIGLGTWINAFQRNERAIEKLTIELQYISFTPLVGLLCVLTCFAIGGSDLADELRSLDGSNGRIYLLIGSGIVLALSSVLLLFAIKLLGMTVSMFTQASVSVVLGSTLNYLVERDKSDKAFLIPGVALSVCAVGVCAYANNSRSIQIENEESETVTIRREIQQIPRSKRTRIIGMLHALFSAVCGAAFSPMFSLAIKEHGEPGWSLESGNPPSVLAGVVWWSVGFGFGGSVLSGLYVYWSTNPLNKIRRLWNAGLIAHGYILGAAVVLSIAEICLFVAGSVAGFAASFAISMANPLVGSLWGIFLWKEFVGKPTKSIYAIGAAAMLYVGSVVLIFFSV